MKNQENTKYEYVTVTVLTSPIHKGITYKCVELKSGTALIDGRVYSSDAVIDFFEDTYQAFAGVMEANQERNYRKLRSALEDFCRDFDMIERNHLTDTYVEWKQASRAAEQFEELFKDLGYSYDDVTNDFGLEYKLIEWGDRLKNRTNYQSHSI